MPQRNPLHQSSTQSAAELRDEADRILAMLEGEIDRMTMKERQFVEDLTDGREVTPRMIFFLRDIKDKYV